MCMMLNVPTAIEAGVADYERVTDEPLQDMFLSYLALRTSHFVPFLTSRKTPSRSPRRRPR